MQHLPRLGILLGLSLHSQMALSAQEAQFGFEMPVTFTVGATTTDRTKNTIPEWLKTIDNPLSVDRNRTGVGGRALLAPTLKLGRHWYFHATLQANTSPFFYYETYHVRPTGARVRLLQGFAAYSLGGENKSLTLKVGKLPTAFGQFAIRYNDRDNALIDAPMAYGSYLLLRPDQIPCSISDLDHQQRVHPNISAYHCNNDESYTYGVLPVTPYGVFGAEVDLTWRRLDARLQLTNSSPSNPQKLGSSSQAAQWAGGAGITVLPGLRVGVSGFRGPWLQSSTQSLLDPGLHWRQFNSSGFGLDAQWARSRLSLSGEWQQLHYRYPNIRSGPSVQYGYAEAKWTLHPRWFAATRLGYQHHSSVTDRTAQGHSHFLPNRSAYEFAVGYRPRNANLIKAGYLWMPTMPSFGPSNNVLGFQWVIDLPIVTWTR